VAKCAYRGERIREIEEKWIGENVKDEEERRRKKEYLNIILENLEEKADCRLEAIPGREFCIFHDPDYWRGHRDEVREEFLKHLKEDEEMLFIGFHLPDVKLPEVVEKELHMELTKLHGTLEAERTTFGEASFSGATFEGEAWFGGAMFLGRTSFNDSVFSRLANFKDSVLFPDLLEKCLNPDNYVSFRRVRFEESGKAVFDGCRMRRVSFIYTDIGRIIFRNVDWGEDFKIFDEKLFMIKIGKGKEFFLRECKEKVGRILDVLNGNKDEEIESEIELGEPEMYKVLTELKELKEKKEMSEEDKKRLEKLEEKLKELKEGLRSRVEKSLNDLREGEKRGKIFEGVEKDEDLTFDNVLTVYRGLRDNYDYHLKYEESGRFFVNEMRLRRIVGRGHGGEKPHGLGGIKMRLSDIVEKVVMWVYEVLALYGESYARPILWAILLIFSSSLIRPFWLWMQNPNWRPELDFILEQVKTSTLVFFQLHWDTRTLTIVERLLSIPILGTLALALRRKLERRVRH